MIGDLRRFAETNESFRQFWDNGIDKVMIDAVLWHDVVQEYQIETLPLYNEAQSIQEYKKQATPGVATELVCSLIRATGRHWHTDYEPTYLESVMMDVDIASFALPYEQFAVGTFNLIEEQTLLSSGRVPSSLSHKRMVDFLTNLLNKKLLLFRVVGDVEVKRQVAYNNIRRWLSTRS